MTFKCDQGRQTQKDTWALNSSGGTVARQNSIVKQREAPSCRPLSLASAQVTQSHVTSMQMGSTLAERLHRQLHVPHS